MLINIPSTHTMLWEKSQRRVQTPRSVIKPCSGSLLNRKEKQKCVLGHTCKKKIREREILIKMHTCFLFAAFFWRGLQTFCSSRPNAKYIYVIKLPAHTDWSRHISHIVHLFILRKNLFKFLTHAMQKFSHEHLKVKL